MNDSRLAFGLTIRVGDVWTGARGQFTVAGYDGASGRFSQSSGATIERRVLLAQYTRQKIGSGATLWIGTVTGDPRG